MDAEQSSREQGPLSAAEIEAVELLIEGYSMCGDWTFAEREEVAGFLPRLLSMLQPPGHSGDATERAAGCLCGRNSECLCVEPKSVGPTDAAVREAVEFFSDTVNGYGSVYEIWRQAQTLLSHVRALVEEYRTTIASLVADLEKLKSGSTDAAVREAVEHLTVAATPNGHRNSLVGVEPRYIRTLLSHVRAVQSPRLTEEQSIKIRQAWARLYRIDPIWADKFFAAFPGVFMEEG